MRSLYAISVALSQLHILDAPLPQNRHSQDALPETWDGVPEQWAHFAREWSRRATYTNTTVRGVEGHLRKVGRWLADNHPEATRPEDWTPQIAAHFVKAATEMTTGEYLPDYQSRRMRTAKGKPFTTYSRVAMISAVRVFFRDVRHWKVVGPLQVDPWQDLRIPHVLNQMRYPNPRDIRRS